MSCQWDYPSEGMIIVSCRKKNYTFIVLLGRRVFDAEPLSAHLEYKSVRKIVKIRCESQTYASRVLQQSDIGVNGPAIG